MKAKVYSDDQLCVMIAGGGSQRNEALKHLYLDPVLKKSVFKALGNMGAQENDILDTFQDAMIILDKNIRGGKFQGKSALRTYFLSIAKWHQMSKLRKQGRMEFQEDMSDYEIYEEEKGESFLDHDQRRSMVREILGRMGEKCKDLLILYMQNIPMKDIAMQRNINVQSAKNAVHRCRQRLRQMIMDTPTLRRSLKVN